jgi:hypothetical protein
VPLCIKKKIELYGHAGSTARLRCEVSDDVHMRGGRRHAAGEGHIRQGQGAAAGEGRSGGQGKGVAGKTEGTATDLDLRKEEERFVRERAPHRH